MKSILLTLLLSLMVVYPVAAEETSPNTYGEPVQDESVAPQADAPTYDDGKLEQLLNGQSQILEKLDEIKQELAIVKVRATQNT